jgi:hypothetical protein
MDGEVGPPVKFDFVEVLSLCRKSIELADSMETFQIERQDALVVAFEKWRGPEARKMADPVAVQEQQNVVNGVNTLRQGAAAWAEQWKDAQQQYNNREHKIAFKKEQNSRSGWEKFMNGLMGQDDSASVVPEAPDSTTPTEPTFKADTGFVAYTFHGHGDWSTAYGFEDGPTIKTDIS